MATITKANRLYFLIASSFLVVLLSSGGDAQAEHTCPYTVVTGDREIWHNGVSVMFEESYRLNFMNHYNLKFGEWEDWGWFNDTPPNWWEDWDINHAPPNKSWVPEYAFPKMMSAGRLLREGIDFSPDTFESQGPWSTSTLLEGAATSGQQYPVMRAVSRTANEIDLLYNTDSSSELIHVLYSGAPWNPGTFPPSSTRVSVSDLLATPKNAYRISGPPEVVTMSADNLEVLARQGNNLLHFRWSRSSGWTVLEPTILTARPTSVNGSDRYLIASKPVVLQRSNTEIDVFALDNFRHLIHYGWDGSVWFAEDITHKLQDGLGLSGDPVIVHRLNGGIDVFGRNSLGQLLHYQSDIGSGWSSEVVTAAIAGLFTNAQLGSQPAAVSPDGQSLIVYYTIDYKLYVLNWTQLLGWVRLQIADGFAIASDPVVVKRGLNWIHTFALDNLGTLIHTSFAPGLGFEGERVSIQVGQQIDNFTPIVTNENRLDVFSRSTAGYLIHHWWTVERGWMYENINLTPGVSSDFDKVGLGRVALRRGSSSLEVFGERLSFADRTVHFTAALVRTVNAWHSNADYSDWASGALHGFKYVPTNSDNWNARATINPNPAGGDDKIEMMCPSFKLTPAERAGTMLHESTHLTGGSLWEHQDNSDVNTCFGVACSDNWIIHTALALSGQLMWTRNHSMNQIQIEYLTDVSQSPASWVPASATSGALSEATNRMNNRILNQPGWVPGTPRPFQ